MKRIALATCLALTVVATAWAESDESSTAKDQTALALTLYNGDLALVKDVRRVGLTAGENRLAWRDVSARIQPETALLRALDGKPPTLLEQNFDFDLLTPQKLLEKSVGQTVQVIRTAPDTGVESAENAVVLAANNGVVLKYKDRIETGIPGRLAFGAVPPGLCDKPTLSMLLDSARGGERRLELSYLTGGLGWKADYVVALDAKEDAMDLNGWVTLTNTSGTAYRDAHLQLVAGEVNRVRPDYRDAMPRGPVLAMAAAAPKVQEESLLDYHLYTLERPTTLLDNQTKQVALMSADKVPVVKEYVLEGQGYYYQGQYGDLGSGLKPAVFIRFENKGGQLGIPLPMGIVRVYKNDSGGQPQFVGEDRIRHTARNETVRLRLGEAFDITADKKQTDYRKVAASAHGGVYETAYRIELRNAKTGPVRVKVVEPMPGDWQIVSENLPHTKDSAHAAVWQVPVPAEGTAVLTWQARVRY